MQNSAGFIFCILVIYMHSPPGFQVADETHWPGQPGPGSLASGRLGPGATAAGSTPRPTSPSQFKFIWILANVRCRASDVRHRIIPMLYTMSYVMHVRHHTPTMSYVPDVRHRISMSYVRHVRHRNIRCRGTYDIITIRCRMFIRYRRSDVRHRIQSSYTTSYVLTCM
jgi:hypothetical protein